MMNFDEFLEATRARVQEELPDTQVKIQQVNKLQGESYIGISVQPEGAAAAATFNIGPAFERYQADPSQECRHPGLRGQQHYGLQKREEPSRDAGCAGGAQCRNA